MALNSDTKLSLAAGIILAFALLVMAATTYAGALFNITDTLSTSIPGSGANHAVSFLSISPITQNETIKITFDPIPNAFGGVGSVATSDIQFTGATLVSSCGAGSDEVTLSTSTAPGDNSVIFTVCSGETVSSGTKTITIGNGKIINPTSTQSYIVRLGGTMPDSGDTRVAILPGVALQASIDTNFSFIVSGVATDTTINGVTTTAATTDTSLAFGTLIPHSPEILGQTLQVTTNAINGFTVTVHEDQDLMSGSGATIHLFDDGNATTTPSPWVSPSGSTGNPATYGHIGVTTDDSDLNSGSFTGSKFAGGFQPTSTLAIFSNDGPSDGSTTNIGKASVAYKIEISPLQAAGNDYHNNLIYVATPRF